MSSGSVHSKVGCGPDADDEHTTRPGHESHPAKLFLEGRQELGGHPGAAQ